jgi:hypothetical protein
MHGSWLLDEFIEWPLDRQKQNLALPPSHSRGLSPPSKKDAGRNEPREQHIKRGGACISKVVVVQSPCKAGHAHLHGFAFRERRINLNQSVGGASASIQSPGHAE